MRGQEGQEGHVQLNLMWTQQSCSPQKRHENGQRRKSKVGKALYMSPKQQVAKYNPKLSSGSIINSPALSAVIRRKS
jgi:hypothetical protein